ncbi:uncharacterized protein V6R79_024835 [Siganus canaliculatus]
MVVGTCSERLSALVPPQSLAVLRIRKGNSFLAKQHESFSSYYTTRFCNSTNAEQTFERQPLDSSCVCLHYIQWDPAISEQHEFSPAARHLLGGNFQPSVRKYLHRVQDVLLYKVIVVSNKCQDVKQSWFKQLLLQKASLNKQRNKYANAEAVRCIPLDMWLTLCRPSTWQQEHPFASSFAKKEVERENCSSSGRISAQTSQETLDFVHVVNMRWMRVEDLCNSVQLKFKVIYMCYGRVDQPPTFAGPVRTSGLKLCSGPREQSRVWDKDREQNHMRHQNDIKILRQTFPVYEAVASFLMSKSEKTLEDETSTVSVLGHDLKTAV